MNRRAFVAASAVIVLRMTRRRGAQRVLDDRAGARAGKRSSEITRLEPFKTAAGYWVFVDQGAPSPVGGTIGVVVKGAPYLTFLTSAVTGLRITRNESGFVLFSQVA